MRINNQEILLDLITLDCEIQQRPLDDDAIKRYMALMQDGAKFPPVEVIREGSNYWLWDGFHRVECAKRLAQKSIAAHVETGGRRDALWLSFSANKAHGLPRQPGIARKIIEKILTDKSWGKKTLSAIAKHVGVTRQYVQRVKGETGAHGATSLHRTDNEKPVSEPKTAKRVQPVAPFSRAAEVEVQSSRGKVYTQRSQEKEHKAGESLKDAVGRVIPEHLRVLWESRKVVAGLLGDLAKIKRSVMQAVESHDPAFSFLNVSAFEANYDQLRATLAGALPYSLCVYLYCPISSSFCNT